MTMDQLEILEAIFKEGSFRAAALRLGCAQPTVSHTVRNLEDELGFPVFSREGYRPQLTEQGRFFYESSIGVLNEFRRLKAFGKEISDRKLEAKVILSVDPLVQTKFLATLVDRAQRFSPKTDIVIKDAILSGGVHDLVSGDSDLAIGPVSEGVPGIDSHPVCSISLVPAISKKLRERLKASSDSEAVKLIPQILVYHRSFDEAADPLLPRPMNLSRGKIFVSAHFMKVKLIKSGLGWGRVGLHELEGDLSGKLLQLSSRVEPPTHLQICVSRSLKKPLGPVAQGIWATCANLEAKEKVRK